MPIIITQVEAHDEDPGGLRTYEVRINREVICRFQHRREDGLAACLDAAVNAVSIKENKPSLRPQFDRLGCEVIFYGSKE